MKNPEIRKADLEDAIREIKEVMEKLKTPKYKTIYGIHKVYVPPHEGIVGYRKKKITIRGFWRIIPKKQLENIEKKKKTREKLERIEQVLKNELKEVN